VCDYAFRVVMFSKALVCVIKHLRFVTTCLLHPHHPSAHIGFKFKGHVVFIMPMFFGFMVRFIVCYKSLGLK
jgi:hypothetical protein